MRSPRVHLRKPLISQEVDILSEYVCADYCPGRCARACQDCMAQGLPPFAAEWLITCLTSDKNADHIRQRFQSDLRQYTPARAKALYWARTLRSIRATVSRALQKWGLIGIL